MPEQADRQEGLTILKEVLSPDAGENIVKRIKEQAEERKYSGLGMAVNAAHELLGSLATGNGAHVDQLAVIEGKIKTVLATHRSVSVQAAYMKTNGRTREDYNGKLGGLIPGGVAIFKDPELKIFVGAAAYGGGPADQDEIIVRQAIEQEGLFTDLPKQG